MATAESEQSVLRGWTKYAKTAGPPDLNVQSTLNTFALSPISLKNPWEVQHSVSP